MKRFLCVILIFILLLSGCTMDSNRLKDPVTFYYPRSYDQQENDAIFFDSGIIGSEDWEASGHREHLNYLLSMYLQGPLNSDLKRPFPYGCKVVEISQEDQALTVTLNSVAAHLDEMKLTVACACLATTCIELTGVETVTVRSVGIDKQVLFTRTYTSSNLLLEDSTTRPVDSTEQTQ